jgi:DNA polymerase I-like protein with 3'-5' exonuclease and polymerase domains/uracil-DNA glycosylase
VVPPSPPASGKVKLVLVGEGPGYHEQNTGRPFVGQSGQFLNRKLEEIPGGEHLRRDAWVTNATLCLEGRTLVRMADGTSRRINNIVKEQSRAKVITVEKDGTFGARRITGWYRNEVAGRRMVWVSHEHSKGNPNGKARIKVTADHNVLTIFGWMKAEDANGILMATGDFRPLGASEEIAIGTLLGDGTLTKSNLQFTHAEDQKEYAELKARALGAPVTRAEGRNGWQAKAVIRTRASAYYRRLREVFYPEGKKRLPEVIMQSMTDLILAIWFLDDGYLRLKLAMKTGGKRGLAELCVAGFPRGDVEIAVRELRRLGYDCYLNNPKHRARIKFTANGTRELSRRIARYVTPAMQYKLMPEDRGRFEPALFNPQCGPFYAKAVIEPARPDRRLVYCIDVEKTHCFVTTSAVVHNCKPIGDNDEKAAAVCCAPRLYRELRGLPADAPIVALGKSAAASILNVKSILLARGFVWETKELDSSVVDAAVRKAKKTGKPEDVLKAQILIGRAKLAHRKVFPTIHPAFVLRLDSWHPVLKVDMERFVRYMRGDLDLNALDDLGPYKVLRTPRRVEEALANLRRDVVAVDIETDGVFPLTAKILCVGVNDGENGVVIRWDDLGEGSRNWLIPELADALSRQLAIRKHVVMHNGYNFDQIALERDGVKLVKKRLDDTLIAAHSFMSHLPKRLDWVASLFTDSNPWKVKFGRRGAEEKGLAPHHMPKKELWFYNNSDGILTAKSWRNMQADLDGERDIYEHDKKLAWITKEMQVHGMPVDLVGRKVLLREMKGRSRELEGVMQKMTGRRNFRPAALDDVRWALFTRFGAPVFSVTNTGLPSTSNGTIEALRSGETEAGRFAETLLQWRAVNKSRSTYVESIREVLLDGRAHWNWRVYGTVSGRWSCRAQSAPRYVKDKKTGVVKIEDRVRWVYAAKPGRRLVYFDLSQSEMRGAAYLSGDEEFIRTCESGDVHSGNAKILFPTATKLIDDLKTNKDGPGKEYRDIAKNSGFGILYSAEIATIFTYLRSHGFDVQLGEVQAMFDEIHDKYSRYYDYCEENLAFCKKHGYQRTAILERKRQIGFFPKPGDVYNFKVQSLIADLMNLRLLKLHQRLPKTAWVIAQIHDALIVECDDCHVDTVKGLIREIWAREIYIPESGCTFVMPAEIKDGQRWSDFG